MAGIAVSAEDRSSEEIGKVVSCGKHLRKASDSVGKKEVNPLQIKGKCNRSTCIITGWIKVLYLRLLRKQVILKATSSSFGSDGRRVYLVVKW